MQSRRKEGQRNWQLTHTATDSLAGTRKFKGRVGVWRRVCGQPTPMLLSSQPNQLQIIYSTHPCWGVGRRRGGVMRERGLPRPDSGSGQSHAG